jgi:Arc/MetJ-type ribon-helix-helix transcriptional regulator
MLYTARQMAKTPSSSKSESVTLRIPNEIFAQIVDHANAHTRGNRSEAIVALLELGLAVAQNQQPPTALTLQDSVRQQELSEAVTTLSEQVSHLGSLVQDTVMQRLTKVEDGLLGEFSA